MKTFILISVKDTLSILLDKENEVFENLGLSLPENLLEFRNNFLNDTIPFESIPF